VSFSQQPPFCLSTHACTHKRTHPHFEDSDVSLSHHIISRKITDIYHHFDYDDSGGPCPVCVCECVRVSMEWNELCTLLRGLVTWNKGVPYLLSSLSPSLSSSFVVALLCMCWRPFSVAFRFELRGVSDWTQVRSGKDRINSCLNPCLLLSCTYTDNCTHTDTLTGPQTQCLLHDLFLASVWMHACM